MRAIKAYIALKVLLIDSLLAAPRFKATGEIYEHSYARAHRDVPAIIRSMRLLQPFH